MRRPGLAVPVATLVLVLALLLPQPAPAQQGEGSGTGQMASAGTHLDTAGRLLAIGVGAAAAVVGWIYGRPYLMSWLFPPPAPVLPVAVPPSWNLVTAITAFETQQAASLGPAVAPVPYYEYVASGLFGAILGNSIFEIYELF